MGELEDVNGREELFARWKFSDLRARSRETREEVGTGEDRKVNKMKKAILSGEIQIPPELKNASIEELIEYVEHLQDVKGDSDNP